MVWTRSPAGYSYVQQRAHSLVHDSPVHKWVFSPQLATCTDNANQWAVEGHVLRLPVDVGHVMEQAREKSCQEQALRTDYSLRMVLGAGNRIDANVSETIGVFGGG